MHQSRFRFCEHLFDKRASPSGYAGGSCAAKQGDGAKGTERAGNVCATSAYRRLVSVCADPSRSFCCLPSAPTRV